MHFNNFSMVNFSIKGTNTLQILTGYIFKDAKFALEYFLYANISNF